MTKKCRFCKLRKVSLLFPANRDRREKKIELFACTNCGFGRHGLIVKCQSCGIVYVDERLSQKQVSTYYEVAEDPLYFSEQGARKRTFARYLAKLEKEFPKKGRLLDIGTNTGLFVRLSLDSGWEAKGLEPNKWAVDYARENYGIEIINKPFEKGVFPKENFDVITMWDVIEHFTDPVEEMKKVFWYLRPGGVFAFSTIDPESMLAILMGTKWLWYMEMHRVFFSRRAAKYYLLKAGFKKIVFRPHWRYLSAGYLASRLEAVSPGLSRGVSRLVASLGMAKMIVPYFANDLFDCYAFKR